MTEGRKNAYVRHHSTGALNFQITFMIFWMALFGALLGATAGAGSHIPPVAGLLFAAVFGSYGANFVLSILGCVRAAQERWWRYPVSIRFLRGARAGADESSVR